MTNWKYQALILVVRLKSATPILPAKKPESIAGVCYYVIDTGK